MVKSVHIILIVCVISFLTAINKCNSDHKIYHSIFAGSYRVLFMKVIIVVATQLACVMSLLREIIFQALQLKLVLRYQICNYHYCFTLVIHINTTLGATVVNCSCLVSQILYKSQLFRLIPPNYLTQIAKI